MKEDFEISKKIKSLRLKRKLTLEHVAEKTGFNKSYLSKIENGKSPPPIATLSRIAQALGISIADFFKNNKSEAIFALTKVNERIKVAKQVTLG